MRPLVKTRSFALLLAASLLAAPALAHEPRTGPRGGALVDAGNYHVEVVTQDKIINVFVSDLADKPLLATGFKALAIVALDGKAARVPLEAAGDASRLTGTAEVPLPKRIKGAVQLTAPDGKTATATFK